MMKMYIVEMIVNGVAAFAVSMGIIGLMYIVKKMCNVFLKSFAAN